LGRGDDFLKWPNRNPLNAFAVSARRAAGEEMRRWNFTSDECFNKVTHKNCGCLLSEDEKSRGMEQF
jgi:hypothetical protein